MIWACENEKLRKYSYKIWKWNQNNHKVAVAQEQIPQKIMPSWQIISALKSWKTTIAIILVRIYFKIC